VDFFAERRSAFFRGHGFRGLRPHPAGGSASCTFGKGIFVKIPLHPKNFYLFIFPLEAYQAVFFFGSFCLSSVFFNARRINATARIVLFSNTKKANNAQSAIFA